MRADLYDRIRFAREGSETERCHTHSHAERYSVGHHTHNMVTLIIMGWQATYDELPRAELIVAAQFHDTPERFTGDVPQQVKELMNGDAFAAMEAKLERFLYGQAIILTPVEKDWLHWCDRLELYLWCIEEVHQRGYNYFWQWKMDYDQKWQHRDDMPKVLRDLQHAAVTNAGRKLEHQRFLEIING